MKQLIQEFERYMQETLGIPVKVSPWVKSRDFPQYLRGRYGFFTLDVLGTPCFLMIDTDAAEQTPAIIGKHMAQVRARHDVEVVYVRQAITGYNRGRLIGHKIPFVVPGNQMYLPMLGLDLREHLKRLRTTKSLFSPATQVLLLYVLWHKPIEPLTPAAMAQCLGYSAMSMTRAFDELEDAGIGDHGTVGKARQIHMTLAGKPLWDQALPYLQTPIRRRFYVASPLPLGDAALAGESALARYTMLADPKAPVFALSARDWTARMRQSQVHELPTPEPEGCEIELWKYAPIAFADQGTVDRLSLYLSMRNSTDERIQSALDALMEGMSW